LAGPLPAQALFGVGDSKPFKNYSVASAFNVSFPAEFEVLSETPEGLILQGEDKIQQLERMTAAAKVVAYPDLATGWGANITEVGQRLAAKRPSGAAELLEAKVDPTGQGLDAYLFTFDGDKLTELWLIAMVKRGSENILCNIACRTPKLLWEAKKDQFQTIMSSFTPVTAPAVAAPEPEPVSVS